MPTRCSESCGRCAERRAEVRCRRGAIALRPFGDQFRASSKAEINMTPNVDDLRAILAAYKKVADASWPQLHPSMHDKSRHWGTATEHELRTELDEYVRDASSPTCQLRLFWKIGPQFAFGGCNA